MIAALGLAFLALLGQPQQRTYYWRDTAGQTHITNLPPPADAEILEPPAPPAMEPEKAVQKGVVVRPRTAPDGKRLAPNLNPAQQAAWDALDQHLAKARAAGNRRTLEAVTDSLIHDCLWGNGLWFLPAAPVLAVALMGLLGWWLALGLGSGPRFPLVGGFLLLGLALGQLLLSVFLYTPQAARLHQNLELLEAHLGTGQPLRAEQQKRLQQRYLALDQAAEPFQAPWRFPAEVRALRDTMKRVVVEP
ncbi:DUF4124 domain-containing protein [Geothrix sp. PMB-07]|uniref:DUF4124 domain-containing protein n=1 Tax=Geothrix sp. PMB-07 TaxID=3068640 RepID=UPI002741D8DE|nr:DUF4124 domain-containing protein [Geothrix sp. PMB-07]WLT31989.1 DUF4124 domain-containing protein [Geothrix sp. PMB-07]